MGEVVYFAYGSNMNINRLKERVGDVELVGVARLRDHELKFNKLSVSGWGCANVEPAEGKEVWGLLYKVKEEQLKELDRYEGAPLHYRRVKLKVLTQEGKEVEAVTYVACEEYKREGLRPADWYLNHLLAAKELLPESYVKELEKHRG